ERVADLAEVGVAADPLARVGEAGAVDALLVGLAGREAGVDARAAAAELIRAAFGAHARVGHAVRLRVELVADAQVALLAAVGDAGVVAHHGAELAADDVVDDAVDRVVELLGVRGAVVAGAVLPARAAHDRLEAGLGHVVEGGGLDAARAVEADHKGMD